MKENRSNLIVLATFWNEREWIEPSLQQIKKINPTEAIICDGCFDPTLPNKSTDGTREIIKNFTDSNPNYKMVEAERVGRIEGLSYLNKGSPLSSSKIKFLFKSCFLSNYRINQAVTFKKMISLSKEWKTGRWFMTYDADQFYPDEMIEKIRKLSEDINNNNIGLMTADERTFFGDFNHATLSYERRNYNNMPHRIYPDTAIYPTRTVVLDDHSSKSGFSSLLPKELFSRHLYVKNVKTKYLGTYHHYKIKSGERLQEGYKLGDRKPPKKDRKQTESYAGNHPTIIRDYFNID